MNKLTRRKFLQTSTLATGPLFFPALAMGQAGTTALNKLNVALIGGGGIARGSAFRECEKNNVVAIADVDDVRGAPGFKAFPGARRYRDFRRMLDQHHKELDAVIVSTPDHTHFPATYAAMERGIAVQTQKPLTHNIWEARVLQKAAHHFGVQTVMGNQGHNFEGMKLIREWVEAGLIGEVREVHIWSNRVTPNNLNALNPLPAQPVPDTLDWDLWTGPAELGPYNEELCPKGWRWWWQYGNGGLADIGCHTLDIPVYALGLGYPSSVHIDNSLNCANELHDKPPRAGAHTYVYDFPRPGGKSLKIYWYEGGHLPRMPESIKPVFQEEKQLSGGCLLVGDKNTIFSPSMRPKEPRLVDNWQELQHDLPPKILPRAVGNPVNELFAAIRGEVEKCGSNFDYAAPLTEIVLLGTIANRSGKKVEFFSDSMTFKDASLNGYVKEPVRKGWEYGTGLL
jgi:predicted dehydrogenase